MPWRCIPTRLRNGRKSTRPRPRRLVPVAANTDTPLVGARLAGDSITAVLLNHRGDAIASKPAPTGIALFLLECSARRSCGAFFFASGSPLTRVATWRFTHDTTDCRGGT